MGSYSLWIPDIGKKNNLTRKQKQTFYCFKKYFHKQYLLAYDADWDKTKKGLVQIIPPLNINTNIVS